LDEEGGKYGEEYVYDGNVENAIGMDALTWFSENIFVLAQHVYKIVKTIKR
jgi:hypothetical protein